MNSFINHKNNDCKNKFEANACKKQISLEETMMMGTKTKIMALSIMVMVSLIGLGGALADPSIHLTVFINEHVSISADPGTAGGQYDYLWEASWPIAENGAALSDPISQNPIIFDAPSTPGDYTLDVLVSDHDVPTNCKADKTINLHVVKCCPLMDANYCTEDTPNWCWYDSCGDPATWTHAWVTNPSSIDFKWYVPSTATVAASTGSCYAPVLGESPFALPDATTPTTSNSVRLDVTQTTTAHGGESIVLYSCENNFNLHWVPELSVSATT